MKMIYRSRASRFAAAALVGASLVGGGYLLLPAAVSTAQQSPDLKTNAPPAEALSHADTLSDAFRFSADQVLPAVVAIRNEVQPKLAKNNEASPPRGGRQLPKGFGNQLP